MATIIGERVVYWLALWGERMGRELSAPTIGEYVRAVEGLNLDVPTFDAAARALYAVERYLPPPIDFYFAARPWEKPSVAAAEALKQLRAAIKWETNTHYSGAKTGWYVVNLNAIDEQYRHAANNAYRSIGMSVDRIVENDKFDGFDRKFLAAFTSEYVNAHPALHASSRALLLKA